MCWFAQDIIENLLLGAHICCGVGREVELVVYCGSEELLPCSGGIDFLHFCRMGPLLLELFIINGLALGREMLRVCVRGADVVCGEDSLWITHPWGSGVVLCCCFVEALHFICGAAD